MASEASRKRRESERRVRKSLPDVFEALVDAVAEIPRGGPLSNSDQLRKLIHAQRSAKTLQKEPGYPTAMRKLRKREQPENPRPS